MSAPERPLCGCNRQTGRTAVHYRQEGCDPMPMPSPADQDPVGESIRRVVVTIGPAVSDLARAMGETAERLGAAWRAVLEQGRRGPGG